MTAATIQSSFYSSFARDNVASAVPKIALEMLGDLHWLHEEWFALVFFALTTNETNAVQDYDLARHRVKEHTISWMCGSFSI